MVTDNNGYARTLRSGTVSPANVAAGKCGMLHVTIRFDLRDAASANEADADLVAHSTWWIRDVPMVPGREYSVFVRDTLGNQGPAITREYTQAMADDGKRGRIRVRVTVGLVDATVGGGA